MSRQSQAPGIVVDPASGLGLYLTELIAAGVIRPGEGATTRCSSDPTPTTRRTFDARSRWLPAVGFHRRADLRAGAVRRARHGRRRAVTTPLINLQRVNRIMREALEAVLPEIEHEAEQRQLNNEDYQPMQRLVVQVRAAIAVGAIT